MFGSSTFAVSAPPLGALIQRAPASHGNVLTRLPTPCRECHKSVAFPLMPLARVRNVVSCYTAWSGAIPCVEEPSGLIELELQCAPGPSFP
jgi:hypothetical protein